MAIQLSIAPHPIRKRKHSYLYARESGNADYAVAQLLVSETELARLLLAWALQFKEAHNGDNS